MFIDMASDSTLQPIFNKLLPNQFWWNIKELHTKSFENGIKILLPFPNTCLCESVYSSYS